MIKNFRELTQSFGSLNQSKVIVVVSSEDDHILKTVEKLKTEHGSRFILIGDSKKIKDILAEYNIDLNTKDSIETKIFNEDYNFKKEDIDPFIIIDEKDRKKAAELGAKYIYEKKADVIMKGSLDTSIFMKAVLNKQYKINTSNILSLVSIFELKRYPKLLLVTDPGISIAPDFNIKIKIIDNAVAVAHKLQNICPKVACCCAIEKVNEKMPATIDARDLKEYYTKKEDRSCIVDGPLGLDNAISLESKRIKGIESDVAGDADIILCNDIESGNYLYKSLVYLGDSPKVANVVVGGSCPIVMSSRADSIETKELSVLLAVALS